jgi:NhaP-type Na+/H+ or K+/H+ antiporter
MTFGSVVVGQVVGKFSWSILLYSVLSLTVIRMLPVYLSFAGMTMSTGRKLFVGWFGPRGLVSVVFAFMVLHRNLPNGEELALTVACTIILSILAHGFSANPLSALMASKK